MNDFLRDFYPTVLQHKVMAKYDNYCKYDNKVLQLFSSSLSLAAFFSAFLAAVATKRRGHRYTMLSAGISYIVGTVLGAGAVTLSMAMLARVFMGFGIGLSNQAIPLYLTEVAPPKHRGMITLFFSLSLAFGLFIANLVNYLSAMIRPWGWRLSFAVCGIPAFILILAGLVLVDTPQSLIARDNYQGARAALRKLRGTENVEDELNLLVKERANTETAEAAIGGWWGQLRSFFWHRHRPHLTISIAMPVFQQLSGYDSILFYGPSLFNAAGFGDGAALYSTIITGFCAMVSTLISLLVVDRVGRRRILLFCSAVMLVSMVGVAALLGKGLEGQNNLPRGLGIADVVLLCVVVLAYKASWGPMAWLIPGEILPQEIRSTGQSIVVSLNMLVKFIVAQSFLSMLCSFKFGLFLFFGGWLVVMGLWTFFFLPETKGIPMDSMRQLWEQHWFWKRYTPPPPQLHVVDSSSSNISPNISPISQGV